MARVESESESPLSRVRVELQVVQIGNSSRPWVIATRVNKSGVRWSLACGQLEQHVADVFLQRLHVRQDGQQVTHLVDGVVHRFALRLCDLKQTRHALARPVTNTYIC